MYHFFLVVLLANGTIEEPMPNELICNQAAMSTPMMVAQWAKSDPNIKFIKAYCKREII